MSKLLNTIKQKISRRFPILANSIRHYLKSKRLAEEVPNDTTWGFKLVGPNQMLTGEFEKEEIQQAKKIMEHIDTFIDIGANVGLYSCLAKKHGLEVIAVEPEYFNLQKLLKNITANGWDDIQVLPAGVGNTIGTAKLYGGGTGASLISGWSGSETNIYQHIPTYTIDTITKPISQSNRLGIKLDVEGFEFEALEGSQLTLIRSIRPIWLIEVDFNNHHPDGENPHYSKIFDKFWKEGYRCFTCDDNLNEININTINTWTKDGIRHFGGHNYIFVHQTSEFLKHLIRP